MLVLINFCHFLDKEKSGANVHITMYMRGVMSSGNLKVP